MCVTELSLIAVKLCDHEPVPSGLKSRVGCGLPVVPGMEVGLLLRFM